MADFQGDCSVDVVLIGLIELSQIRYFKDLPPTKASLPLFQINLDAAECLK